jgi:hypothetical protein
MCYVSVLVGGQSHRETYYGLTGHYENVSHNLPMELCRDVPSREYAKIGKKAI